MPLRNSALSMSNIDYEYRVSFRTTNASDAGKSVADLAERGNQLMARILDENLEIKTFEDGHHLELRDADRSFHLICTQDSAASIAKILQEMNGTIRLVPSSYPHADDLSLM